MRHKRQDIFKTISEYKKLLEEKGYDVIYIGLYGSQNYNVDDENYVYCNPGYGFGIEEYMKAEKILKNS